MQEVLLAAARAAAATAIFYVYLVLLLRVTGNRTLAKLRAFDFVVTIAIGSLLASAVVQGTAASLARGMAAVTVLITLQLLVSAAAMRSPTVRRIVTSPPVTLVKDGRPQQEAIQQAKVAPDDLELALRTSGLEDMREARAIILETTGDVTVVRRDDDDG